MRRILDKWSDLRRNIRHAFGRRDIDFLLANAPEKAPFSERILWLQQVVQWLRAPARSDDRAQAKAQRIQRIETVRLRFLLQILERNPEWKARVSATICTILGEASALDLFSLTGLMRTHGIFSEASNLLLRKILPETTDLNDLGPLFNRIFVHDDDEDWIRDLPREYFEQIVDLIRHDSQRADSILLSLSLDMVDALLILGASIASIGLSHDLRMRMSDQGVLHSPFLELNQRLTEIAKHLRTVDGLDSLVAPLASAAEPEIRACRERVQDVYAHLEKTGVSVNLVYRLEAINALLTILVPHPAVDRAATTQNFIAELIREGQDGESFGSLIRRNLYLISRKVVERVGQSGEHYITSTPREWFAMLKAGGGGGLLTVFTTVIKISVSHASLALFFEGFFHAINYSVSFLAMQSAHFSLATKQPSMTASALANKLDSLNHRKNLKEFVDVVARIARSQFAAVLGNVGFVVPGAMLFDYALLHFTGHHVVDPNYAMKLIHNLNPIESLTIPAAAITGGILWLGPITGGWVENWSAYHRIPEAIAKTRFLHAVIGESGAARVAKIFEHEINGIASNISLGFLLAFTPIAGVFFGLPLDIRHITLSSGSLAIAVSSIGWQAVPTSDFVFAVVGIVCILALNFGISFSLALFVAIRARRIKRVWIFAVIRGVLRRLATKPSQFFFPTGN